MTRKLFTQIREKAGYLCIGLDSDFNKIPSYFLEKEYPLYEFNKKIVKATSDIAVAYKLNLAFYECLGVAGWMSLELTVSYIKRHYPEIFIIADAKRGDIGNTSGRYASAFFHNMDVDAVTVSPYMGRDSVDPFIDSPGKWAVILALTSNAGADDFQMLKLSNRNYLFEQVIKVSKNWGNKDNMMYVVGATRSEWIKRIRKIIPDHFLLIPGVGAQGGSLEEVSRYGFNRQCGILVNVSRSIIFADVTSKFDYFAREKALEIQKEMEFYLRKRKVI